MSMILWRDGVCEFIRGYQIVAIAVRNATGEDMGKGKSEYFDSPGNG